MAFEGKYTAEQIARAYQMHKEGVSGNKIEEALGFKKTVAHYMILRLDKMLQGKTGKSSVPYKDAVRIIKDNLKFSSNLTNGMTKNGIKDPTDHFTMLEDAFKNLQQAMEKFMVIELEKRTAKEKRRYEEQLAQVETLREEAKQDNWINHLKKTFNA